MSNFVQRVTLAVVVMGAGTTLALADTFIDKQDYGHIRLVSYNVYNDSCFLDANPQQAARFKRMMQALQPDIVCLQEISRPAKDVAVLMDDIVPAFPSGPCEVVEGERDDGSYSVADEVGTSLSWHAYKGRDCVIASPWPLKMTADKTEPAGQRELAMAVVDLPNETYEHDIYILNAHYKCCESTTNDPKRQQQSDALVSWMRDARTPGGNIDLPSGTPMLVVGDLNIVGASGPLDTLVTGDIRDNDTYGPDRAPDWNFTYLRDAKPLHNGRGEDTYTWRDDGQEYEPGRLDYVIYTDSVLQVAQSFVLNTTTMTEKELAETGLHWLDVTWDGEGKRFDHLPVVVDFQPRRPRYRESALEVADRRGTETVCPVHALEMDVTVVPFRYGLIRRNEKYEQAAQRDFPHANTHILGGCWGGSLTHALVRYCPDCRVAYDAWLREYRRP